MKPGLSIFDPLTKEASLSTLYRSDLATLALPCNDSITAGCAGPFSDLHSQSLYLASDFLFCWLPFCLTFVYKGAMQRWFAPQEIHLSTAYRF